MTCLHPVALGSPDAYAPSAGFADGWPVGFDGQAGTANLAHCYAMVGVGRNLSPDTGTGGELYAVIGHAPRHLDQVVEHAWPEAHRKISDRFHHLIDELPALHDGFTGSLIVRAAQAVYPAKLESQPTEHLAEMIVQLPRNAAPFIFLRGHQLQRQTSRARFCRLGRGALA
jgi:hypothetical protein